MAQKVTGYIKLQIPAAKGNRFARLSVRLSVSTASTSRQFIKEFNERTKDQAGFKIPVVITVYADRSFTFVTKTPPDPDPHFEGSAASTRASGVPNKDKVATITKAQVQEDRRRAKCPT